MPTQLHPMHETIFAAIDSATDKTNDMRCINVNAFVETLAECCYEVCETSIKPPPISSIADHVGGSCEDGYLVQFILTDEAEYREWMAWLRGQRIKGLEAAPTFSMAADPKTTRCPICDAWSCSCAKEAAHQPQKRPPSMTDRTPGVVSADQHAAENSRGQGAADATSAPLPKTTAQTIEIPGLSGRYTPISKRYLYDLDKCRCPNCNGLGIPWAGWFHCDDCPCMAVVADGRAFIPEGSMIRG